VITTLLVQTVSTRQYSPRVRCASLISDLQTRPSSILRRTYTDYTSESSYSSESSESYSDSSATDYNTTVVYSSSSYPSSGYPSSSYPTPSYSGYSSSSSSSSRPGPPSGYPTVPPTPTVYGVSSSSSTTTTPPPGNNGYGGTAGRNAVLPAAFVTLMAVMVAMAVV